MKNNSFLKQGYAEMECIFFVHSAHYQIKKRVKSTKRLTLKVNYSSLDLKLRLYKSLMSLKKIINEPLMIVLK